jgi:hypothetical protein
MVDNLAVADAADAVVDYNDAAGEVEAPVEVHNLRAPLAEENIHQAHRTLLEVHRRTHHIRNSYTHDSESESKSESSPSERANRNANDSHGEMKKTDPNLVNDTENGMD